MTKPTTDDGALEELVRQALPPRLTPILRAVLDQYRTTLPAAEFRGFVRHLAGLAAQYEAELVRHAEGADRARALHRLMEAELKKIHGVPVTCARGCSACCHLEVEITRDEGELLAALVLAGHPIDTARLATQAARERKSPAWEAKTTPDNACVFLGADGACTVYASRPGSCRKLLVVSPAIECARVGGVPQPVTIPLAELIMTVALNLPGNFPEPDTSISKSVTLGLARLAAAR